eukprot:CAMPEP_0170493940 /NCGR_PEP_ID=MMETSP0208-20121228/14357_1 /TAXON_ID=197538 /ORGANISM="Strombidium inclinatum, Strain S3" /LENGTH=213 /DNA_ID=CAMNT_0010769925 /DNA_START=1 /DNA_END=638 /DNA_ORIENTATION=-
MNESSDDALSLDLSMGRIRKQELGLDYHQESKADKRVRKCTMINIIILFLAIGLLKLLVLIGFGYFTFRRVDRPDCYASSEKDKPSPSREDDDYENVTWEYMLIIQIGFWLCVIEALLFFPSLKSKTVQNMLCFMIVPDVLLFLYLNYVVLRHPSRVCMGDYMTEGEIERCQGYMPREEGSFLMMTLLFHWGLVAFLALFLCLHICLTFCFRT